MAEPTDGGWLDAAIKAAAEALEKPRGCPVTVWDGPYRTRCSLGGGGWKCSQHGQFSQPGLEERESIARAVISAVAPHIRRAVLLEAAEKLRAEVQLQSSWLWHDLGESALERVAAWLDKRAGGNG